MTEAVIGDETGLLKHIVGKEYYRYGDIQSRDLQIVSMARLSYAQGHLQSEAHHTDDLMAGNDDNSEKSNSNGGLWCLSLVRATGGVELWRRYGNGMLGMIDSGKTSITQPVGILSGDRYNDQQNIIVYGKNGQVCICKSSADNRLINGSSNEFIGEYFQVSGPLSAGDTCNNGLAFGGNENDLKLYDQTTLQCIWKAKNVPHDNLRLRVPIWITAVAFIQPETTSISTGAHIVTGTGYKHVRLYDTRMPSRQPSASIDISDEFRVTAIRPSLDGSEVFVGDTSGGLNLWDLRNLRKKSTLKGAAGSIRDIKLSSDGNLVGAVSLDRFLRIYSSGSTAYELENSVYLKNRLTSCLIFNGNDDTDFDGSESDADDQESDGNDINDDHVEEYNDSSDESEDSHMNEADSNNDCEDLDEDDSVEDDLDDDAIKREEDVDDQEDQDASSGDESGQYEISKRTKGLNSNAKRKSASNKKLDIAPRKSIKLTNSKKRFRKK